MRLSYYKQITEDDRRASADERRTIEGRRATLDVKEVSPLRHKV